MSSAYITYFPPWTSLKTYDKIGLWDAKLSWKWERSWHFLLFLHQQRCKILFQTSKVWNGKGFCSFFMLKYIFPDFLSGCMSVASSAVLSDHRHWQFFLQVNEHPQEHVHILPDCSLLLLARTIFQATWWCWILQVQHILCSRIQS